jgi:hypothetical protein
VYNVVLWYQSPQDGVHDVLVVKVPALVEIIKAKVIVHP